MTSLWPIAMAELQRLLLNPAAAQVKNIIVYIHTVIYIYVYIYMIKCINMTELQRALLNPAAAQVNNVHPYHHVCTAS